MSSLRATRLGRAGLLLPLLLSYRLRFGAGSRRQATAARGERLCVRGSRSPARNRPGRRTAGGRRYNDPQLDRLMDEALAGSPDLAAAAPGSAAPRVSRSRPARRCCRRSMRPRSGSSRSRARTSPPAGPQRLARRPARSRLGSRFDLDLWGKNRAALRAAKKDAEAALYDDADEARLALTTGIAATYADLAVALCAARQSREPRSTFARRR